MRAGSALATIAATCLAACSGEDYVERVEAAFPPLGEFVEVEALRIHYVDEGAGPAVILIHGANGNLRDWTFSMVAALADTHRVVAFDRPGHGYSDRPDADGATPATQARILSEAARKLGVDRAVIVGHSWGGAVAAAWALDHPDQVEGVALISAATYDWGGSGGMLYKLGATPVIGPVVSSTARAYVSGERLKDLVDGVFAPNATPPGYIAGLGLELALRPRTFRHNARDISLLNDHLAAQSSRYGALVMPVIVMHGDADETVGLEIHAVRFARDAPGAELRVFPGVGHMLHHTEQAAVMRAINDLTPVSTD